MVLFKKFEAVTNCAMLCEKGCWLMFMWSWIVSLASFFTVLFLYIHVQHQLATSSLLELLELDNNWSKEKLEEICSLRQPVVFSCKHELSHLQRATALPALPHSVFMLQERNNASFLRDSGLDAQFQRQDRLLRPAWMAHATYDIFANKNHTQNEQNNNKKNKQNKNNDDNPLHVIPLQYSLNARNYFMATSGTVHVQLVPPCFERFLHPISNYVDFEFLAGELTADEQRRIKKMEVVLQPGQILFVPPYWWYSISLESQSSVSYFGYRTFINACTVLPHQCLYLLQHQNIILTTE